MTDVQPDDANDADTGPDTPTGGAPEASASVADQPDASSDDGRRPSDDTATASDIVPPQYGVGPFSLREVILGGVWLVAFVLSFLSTVDFTFSSVWVQGIAWILPVGLPTVAVFLLALRRLSPSGIRRVGSLGIDQFASVAFSVAAVVWLGQVWSQVQVSVTGGRWALSWMPWAQLVLMLAGVVLTVFAPFIGGICEDFRHRPAVPAHRNARPVRPVVARPRPVPPATATLTMPREDDTTEEAVSTPVVGDDAPDVVIPQDAFAPADAAPQREQRVEEPAVVQAFWALVPEERDVVDEDGSPLFRIGPTAWALAIEDRGDTLVIRHEDGRVGFLHDVTGVTRG